MADACPAVLPCPTAFLLGQLLQVQNLFPHCLLLKSTVVSLAPVPVSTQAVLVLRLMQFHDSAVEAGCTVMQTFLHIFQALSESKCHQVFCMASWYGFILATGCHKRRSEHANAIHN